MPTNSVNAGGGSNGALQDIADAALGAATQLTSEAELYIAQHHAQAAAAIAQSIKAAVEAKQISLGYDQMVYQLNAAWLEGAITGIAEDLTMQGAPQLEIDLVDSLYYELLNSGLFDTDANGRLTNVGINYPLGSKYEWVLFQVSPQADWTIKTYWIPRVVDALMHTFGPFSANRNQMTQAQFIKAAVTKALKAQQKATKQPIPFTFTSKQLTTEQPIGEIPLPTGTSINTPTKTGVSHSANFRAALRPKALNTANNAAAAGTTAFVGIGKIRGLTVRGAPMTAAQKVCANQILQVCDQKKAGKIATLAALYAAIWESNLGQNIGPNSAGQVGTFQGKGVNAGGPWPEAANTVGQCTSFLGGGKGFQGGGAMSLSKSISDPIEIAVRVEVPSIWPDNAYAAEYSGGMTNAKALKECEDILAAGGGATGFGGVQSSPTEDVQNSNYSIGAKVDFWTGINQLAQNVNWEILVDGPDIYYDSMLTLIRAIPRIEVQRTDETVSNWQYDWDNRQIVTNLQITLLCNPFDFAPGDVFWLKGDEWGPAARGSTAGLPGRWLISEIERQSGDIVSTITLVQPTAPIEAQVTVKSGTVASASALAAYAAAQRLSNARMPYSQATRYLVQNAPVAWVKHDPKWGYDCSASTSWILLTAGFKLPNGAIWGSWAPVSGDFESWGEAGEGDQMTVWCTSGHVFIEFQIPGIGAWQANTSYQSANGLSYGDGPQLFRWGQNGQADASSGAFKARHWPGT